MLLPSHPCESTETSSSPTPPDFFTLAKYLIHSGAFRKSIPWSDICHRFSYSHNEVDFESSASSTVSMFIQTETTPNDDSLKFIPGVPVMEESNTAEFLDTRSALKSPLAIRLMGIEGVTAVFYGPDFVTVSKDSETAWSIIKPEIYATLMEFFSAGQPLFRSDEDREAAGPQDTRILDTDSETVAMIKELLDTRVRPAIMEDGGDIEYRGFTDDGVVQVKLKGSCRGCDSSTVTLKSGIERMLMHYIPEVKGVEQILDQEETIALNEFEKLENRLSHEKSRPAKKNSSMAQYMSV
ncbi:NifU-like protein 5, mitochondrial [Grifola frondosa]|uniref:NifU-like protein 5, mitochondrial n=1 Tax=Grifola frondosa TaxID=5627 RepID=A0A1C7MU86_GRIFR|nr:NifU-like protein 5, mitochondrial [Grifola frondosa]